jgi:MerR family transcriptional regulator, light-induced transcriptional regulator
MTEGPSAGTRATPEVSADHVDALAARALTVVARQTARAGRGPSPLLIEMLETAALDSSPWAITAALDRMAAAGVPPAEIADRYIPAVARRMGDKWCSDEMGFAQVTIGCARLQGALRELGPEWRADHNAPPDAPCILIAVGSEIYHTLGAVVLAGQMRRAGLSVNLHLGTGADDLTYLLQRIRVQAVFLSASSGESLESLRKLVDAVRTAPAPRPPVVIGGTITWMADADGVDIAALTGADHVTCDPEKALSLCGIKTSATIRSVSDPGA